MTTTLQYVPLQSVVDASFWTALANKKLDDLKLSEEPVPITGDYSVIPRPNIPAFGHVLIHGTLHNFNTWEGFKNADRNAIMQQAAAEIWRTCAEDGLRRPQSLCRMVLLTYADLKNWQFYYWFAFPALKFPVHVQHRAPLAEAHGPDHASSIALACAPLLQQATTHPPVALVRVRPDSPAQLLPLTTLCGDDARKEATAASMVTGDVLVVVADAQYDPAYPAWPLRNVLAMLVAHLGECTLRVLCLRGDLRGVDVHRCTVLTLQLPGVPGIARTDLSWVPEASGWEAALGGGKLAPRKADMRASMDPKALASEAVDLNVRLMRWRFAPGLDTQRLGGLRCLLLGAGTLGCAVARTLLGWHVRHLTLVDSGRVSFSNPVRQCLFTYEDCLQGGRPKAEAAARTLHSIFPGVQARGVQLSIPMPGHALTPTEQAAALAAATELEALIADHDVVFLLTDTRESRWLPTLLAAKHRRIAITAALAFDSFVVLRHGLPVAPAYQSTTADDSTDAALANEFTTDSNGDRGDRGGAATVPAAPAVDAPASSVPIKPPAPAAGADTAPSTTRQGHSHRLGCYFCNDVVAPQDSTLHRSLDQQCTVTRPGLAFLAAAVAGELCVNVVQHPLGGYAPHLDMQAGGEVGLGAVPHMIRGYLSTFAHTVFHGHAYERCSACSERVAAAWAAGGDGFLLAALEDPRVLEEAAGLAELHSAVDSMLEAESEGQGGEDDWTEL